jgi:hypothetical protein
MAPSSSFPERDAAVALLVHRIHQLPGFEVLGHSRDDGGLVMTIDVGGTGFSARQVARMVRMLGGVELQVHGSAVLAATFDATDALADAGTRLLFGLSHASYAPGLRTGATVRTEISSHAEIRYARPPVAVGSPG